MNSTASTVLHNWLEWNGTRDSADTTQGPISCGTSGYWPRSTVSTQGPISCGTLGYLLKFRNLSDKSLV